MPAPFAQQTIPSAAPRYNQGRKMFGGRYTLLRALGRGGMGEVWLAQDNELGVQRALKFAPPEVAADARSVAMLKREAIAGTSLAHPNIVRIFDFVADAAEMESVVVMEVVEGKSLADLQAKRIEEGGNGFFEPEEIEKWLRDACAALDYAHGEGRVHRDIKPQNLMVETATGRLKIMDFGISRRIGDSFSQLTGKDSSGTLPYMSPQQVMGEPPHASDDIYGLGATLYDLLSGSPPFIGGALEMQVREKAPAPILTRRAEVNASSGKPVPQAWEAALMKCLAKKREERPANTQSVAALAQSVPLNLSAAEIGSQGLPPGREERGNPLSGTLKAKKTAKAPQPTRSPLCPSKPQPVASAPAEPLRGLNGRLWAIAALILLCLGAWSILKNPKEIKQGVTQPLEDNAAKEESAGQKLRTNSLDKKQRDDAEKASWEQQISAQIKGVIRDASNEVCDEKILNLIHDGLWPDAFVEAEKKLRDLITPSEQSPTAQLRLITAKMSLASTRSDWGVNRARKMADVIIEVARPEELSPLWLLWASDYTKASGDSLRSVKFKSHLDAKFKTSGASSRYDGVNGLSYPYSKKFVDGMSLMFATGTGELKAATKDAPFINSLGMKFVPVPINAGPSKGHRVLFSIWETRSKDYAAFVNDSTLDAGEDWKTYSYKGESVGRGEGEEAENSSHPVVNVSHDDGVAFCVWLTEKDRASGFIAPQDEYRLPTDTEWSYAAGIGDKENASASPEEKQEAGKTKLAHIYPWGVSFTASAISGNYADTAMKVAFGSNKESIDGYTDGYTTTAPVGSFVANSFGIYDLGGNVEEWTSSEWESNSNPYVLRGGSWVDYAESDLLTSYRSFRTRVHRYFGVNGFRVVLVVADD